MEIKAPVFKKIFIASKIFLLKYKILFFVLVALISFGYLAAIFYSYAWRIQPAAQAPPKISVDLALYQKVMENLGQRELNFEQEASQNYLDPFK